MLTHLTRPDPRRRRHVAALPARQTRRGAARSRRSALIYLIYNSGYYLPFGGGSPGPRFMITMLPVPGLPAGHRPQALSRPDDRAGGGLDHDDLRRHHHPSAGRLRERDGHLGAAAEQRPTSSRRSPRPSGSGAAGARSGRSSSRPAGPWCSPPRPPRRACALSSRELGAGVLALLAWGLFAALGPTVAGDRPPGPVEHQRRGRSDGAEPDAARRRPLPPGPAGRLLGHRGPCGPRGDVGAAPRAASGRRRGERRAPAHIARQHRLRSARGRRAPAALP